MGLSKTKASIPAQAQPNTRPQDLFRASHPQRRQCEGRLRVEGASNALKERQSIGAKWVPVASEALRSDELGAQRLPLSASTSLDRLGRGTSHEGILGRSLSTCHRLIILILGRPVEQRASATCGNDRAHLSLSFLCGRFLSQRRNPNFCLAKHNALFLLPELLSSRYALMIL